jgi:hypothetical protein
MILQLHNWPITTTLVSLDLSRIQPWKSSTSTSTIHTLLHSIRLGTSRTSTRFAAKLKLFLKTQSIIQLTGSIFSGVCKFFHKFLQKHKVCSAWERLTESARENTSICTYFCFANLLQDFSLARFAQHATNKHFKENEKRLVQGKDQVQLANYSHINGRE